MIHGPGQNVRPYIVIYICLFLGVEHLEYKNTPFFFHCLVFVLILFVLIIQSFNMYDTFLFSSNDLT